MAKFVFFTMLLLAGRPLRAAEAARLTGSAEATRISGSAEATRPLRSAAGKSAPAPVIVAEPQPKTIELVDIDALYPDPRAPFYPPSWAPTAVLWNFETTRANEFASPRPVMMGQAPDPVYIAPRDQLADTLPDKKGHGKLRKKSLAKKTAGLKRKRKKMSANRDDVEEVYEFDRDPAADDSATYVFTDAIRSVTDFNGQWEVSFRTEPGRYQLMGQPDEISDFQSHGTFLKATVDRTTRRILSLEPVQVRFRPIR